MKLVSNVDCGNAPKKQFVLDFTIAFVKADIKTILEMLDDNAEWNMVGTKIIKGKEGIRTELESIDLKEAQLLKIENILSHGKLCSANGEIHYPNSNIAFCNAYTFTSHSKVAKIKTLKSYSISI